MALNNAKFDQRKKETEAGLFFKQKCVFQRSIVMLFVILDVKHEL
jgi:hypothetical protein